MLSYRISIQKVIDDDDFQSLVWPHSNDVQKNKRFKWHGIIVSIFLYVEKTHPLNSVVLKVCDATFHRSMKENLRTRFLFWSFLWANRSDHRLIQLLQQSTNLKENDQQENKNKKSQLSTSSSLSSDFNLRRFEWKLNIKKENEWDLTENHRWWKEEDRSRTFVDDH